MQWRMLARRCPSGSMTLVGDFGQASRPGALARLGRRCSRELPDRVAPRRVTLTVNYRTPAEIMDVANRLLPAAAPGVEPARPVRSTGAHPVVRTVASRRARRRGRRRRAGAPSATGGTVAVIAPLELHDALVAALADVGAVAGRGRGDRRADRGARAARREGPRVRPRGRGRAGRARRRPTAPGCASSTSCSPGPPARSRWSHAAPLPEGARASVDPRTQGRHRMTDHRSRPRRRRRRLGPRAARRRPRRGGRRRAARRRRGAAPHALGSAPGPDRRARRRRARRGDAASSRAIGELAGRAGSYAGLRFAVDTTDPANGALMARAEERGTAINNEILFVELEWAALPDEPRRRAARRRPARVLPPLPRVGAPLPPAPADRARGADPRREGAHRPRRVGAAVRRAHLGDHRRRSTATAVSLEEGLSRLQSPDRDVRRAAAEAVTAGLAPGLRTRAFVFNTLLADKSIDDRLRSYPTLDREPQPRQRGERRVGAGARRRGAGAATTSRSAGTRSRRSCSASTGSPTTTAWRRSRAPTRSSAGARRASSCSTPTRRSRPSWPTPRSGSSTSRGSTRRCGRASGRARSARTPCRRSTRTCCSTGRRAGATCSRSPTSSATACTPTSRATRGSSTRPRRSRWPRPRRCSARPSPSAGCSTRPTTPTQRLALLAESLEGQIATVFRQIAMNRFEDRVHTDAARARASCRSTTSRELWAETQTAMLGDAVEITEGYRTWWSYIPHFIGTPGYVYAYAYGQLLALSVYRAYEEQGADFVPRYLELLARGGSTLARGARPRSSASTSPIPAFWDGGLAIVAEQLDGGRGGRPRRRAPLTRSVIRGSRSVRSRAHARARPRPRTARAAGGQRSRDSAGAHARDHRRLPARAHHPGDRVERVPGRAVERAAGRTVRPGERRAQPGERGAETDGDEEQLQDLLNFNRWLEATTTGDSVLADLYERRFRDEFRPAFDAWVAQGDALNDPDLVATPLRMPEYVLADKVESDRLEDLADLRFEQGEAGHGERRQVRVHHGVLRRSALLLRDLAALRVGEAPDRDARDRGGVPDLRALGSSSRCRCTDAAE